MDSEDHRILDSLLQISLRKLHTVSPHTYWRILSERYWEVLQKINVKLCLIQCIWNVIDHESRYAASPFFITFINAFKDILHSSFLLFRWGSCSPGRVGATFGLVLGPEPEPMHQTSFQSTLSPGNHASICPSITLIYKQYTQHMSW